MKTIHKKVLPLETMQQVWMHPDDHILCAQNQGGQICIWYTTDKVVTAPEIKRNIYIVGTGGIIPSDGRYIGTVQLGAYVWHLYEERIV